MPGPATFIEPYGQGHEGGKIKLPRNVYDPRRRYRITYPRCVYRAGDNMRQGNTTTAFVDDDYTNPTKPMIGTHEYVENYFRHPHLVNGKMKRGLSYHVAHMLASKAEKQLYGQRLYARGLRETKAVIAQNRREMRVRRGLG